jgi:hypothetical protein
MKTSFVKIALIIVVLFALLTGCEKDVEKLKVSDFYGAWTSTYSSTDTRMMLCIKNNDAYSGAADNDAFVMLSITPTDTTVIFQGSYEVIEGYLKSSENGVDYANEILDYSKKEFVMYSEITADNTRTWEKVSTDLLNTAP